MLRILSDLDFVNLPGILISLLPAILNFFILAYILFLMPKNKLSLVFGFFTFSLTFWQMGDVFLRMSRTAETAAYWDSILSLGWSLIAPTALYFAILFSGKKNFAESLSIMTFIPSLALNSIYQNRRDIHLFDHHPFWGWIIRNDGFTPEIVQRYWISCLMLITLVLLIDYAIRCKSDTIRKQQAVVVALGFAFPIIQGILTQFIFPIFLEKQDIPLTSTSMTIFSIATFVGLNKYKLFSLSDSLKLDTIIEKMKDIVIHISMDLKIIYINAFGEEMLGFSTLKSEEYPIDILFGDQKNDARYFRKEIIDITFKNNHIENQEVIFYRLKGEKISVLLSSQPIVNNNLVQGALIIARNITELKVAEEMLIKQNEELKKTNSELDKFVYSTSHDLRAPLSSILGLLNILSMENKEDQENKYIQMIRKSVNKLDGFIQDIISYSRNTRLGVEKEKIDFDMMVNETLDNLRFMQGNDHIFFSKEIHNKTDFYSDKKRISIIFNNIISNAIKYYNPRREESIVNIFIRTSPEKAMIEISDNGQGIKKEYHEKIFDMFYRASESSTGSGLGLYIVKEIIKKLGGEIDFESVDGVGTTFKILIPNES